MMLEPFEREIVVGRKEGRGRRKGKGADKSRLV